MKKELKNLERYLHINGFLKEASIIKKIAEDEDSLYEEGFLGFDTYVGPSLVPGFNCNSLPWLTQDIVLSMAGMAPFVGEAADLKSAIDNYYCGNYITGTIALISAIPGLGNLSGLLKLGISGGKLSAAKAVAKSKAAMVFSKNTQGIGRATIKPHGNNIEVGFFVDDFLKAGASGGSQVMTKKEIAKQLTKDYETYLNAVSWFSGNGFVKWARTTALMTGNARIIGDVTKIQRAIRGGNKAITLYLDNYIGGLRGLEEKIQNAVQNEEDPCDAGITMWIDENENIHRCSENPYDNKIRIDISYDDKKRKKLSESEKEEIERLINED